MAAKKLAVMRDNSIEELEAQLAELKAGLSREKAIIASGTRAEKPSKIRNARRQIARVLTIIREKKTKRSGVIAGHG